MSALLNALEIAWGDIALLLSVPRQGLGNAAISGSRPTNNSSD